MKVTMKKKLLEARKSAPTGVVLAMLALSGMAFHFKMKAEDASEKNAVLRARVISLEMRAAALQTDAEAYRTQLSSIESTIQRINVIAKGLDVQRLAGAFQDEFLLADNVTMRLLGISSHKRNHTRQEEPLFVYAQRLTDMTARIENRLSSVLDVMHDHKHLFASLPVANPTVGYLTSNFGHRRSPFTGERVMHHGVDIAATTGTPIFAPADGIVKIASVSNSLGNFVVLDHGKEVETKFGHNSKLYVRQGEKVRRGDLIARVGSTGRSTGPHLHYEVWVQNRPVNPDVYVHKEFLLSPNSQDNMLVVGGE